MSKHLEVANVNGTEALCVKTGLVIYEPDCTASSINFILGLLAELDGAIYFLDSLGLSHVTQLLKYSCPF